MLACAWYLEARVVKDRAIITFSLAMSGTFLENPVSSFVAEAMGLDESSEFVMNLLHKCGSSTSAVPWKRHRVAESFS